MSFLAMSSPYSFTFPQRGKLCLRQVMLKGHIGASVHDIDCLYRRRRTLVLLNAKHRSTLDILQSILKNRRPERLKFPCRDSLVE